MSKYDELKRLAQAVTPETEAMHVFGDGSYVGEHQVLVSASQKMRDIVASYFGPGSDDDWEFREHGSALACIEDYDKWLRANRLVVGARQILELIAEHERLREALNFSCKSLCQVTSSDGSGHADIALSVLRLAGVNADEREALVDGWKANVQWRIDSAMQEASHV